MGKTFDRLKAALEDAIAFAQGDMTKGTLHTPESLAKRRKERHRKLANLRSVPKGDPGTPDRTRIE